MNKTTKITLEELIRKKEQMLESKKKPKTETLYIKSLDGTITIESPTAAMAREAQAWKTVMRIWCIPALQSHALNQRN